SEDDPVALRVRPPPNPDAADATSGSNGTTDSRRCQSWLKSYGFQVVNCYIRRLRAREQTDGELRGEERQLGSTFESKLEELASLREPGSHPVDVPIMCSITRFGLRNARSLASSYLAFRHLLREAARTPPDGLLKAAFLVEDPKTWYSFSIWSGAPMFSSQLPAH